MMASALIIFLLVLVWWWAAEGDPPAGRQLSKVIYMGVPMRLDESTNPPTLYGFFRFAALIYFNGVFMPYEGSYWSALVHWFKGPPPPPDAFV